MRYDKNEIKELLTIDNIFTLLQEFGANPIFTSFGILSETICHNPPEEGSKKLYYYENSNLFQCYSNCGSFDIFQLVIKVAEIQWGYIYDLNDAVRWIAQRFGIVGLEDDIDKIDLEDWNILNNYERIQEIGPQTTKIVLEEYDSSILSKFNYSVKIQPWLKEGISQEVINQAMIGYYPGQDQITIPHFDEEGRFVGLRGRTLCQEDAERLGKYRPIKINGTLYAHPLGMNLYNLSTSKGNIGKFGKAIIYESEKSCLLSKSYFGTGGDISVACCGSNISQIQIQSLVRVGAKEIVIAFDRQFENLNSQECKNWIKKLTRIYKRFKNDALISIIWDKKQMTDYKSSPIDHGPEIFMKLYKDRIFL